jgi:hypothetical protein
MRSLLESDWESVQVSPPGVILPLQIHRTALFLAPRISTSDKTGLESLRGYWLYALGSPLRIMNTTLQ